MLLKEITPFVRYARHFTITDAMPHSFKNVRTRDNRLFFITDGQGDIEIEGERFALTRDTLVLIRAGESYRLEPKVKLSSVVINFDYTDNFSSIRQSFHPYYLNFPGVLEDVTFSDARVLCSHIVIRDGARFSERLRSLASEAFSVDEWRDAFLCASMKAIIIDIVKTVVRSNGSHPRSQLVDEVARYLKEHYSECVENETLSAHFHFTSIYINRLFKKEMGTSLRQYLISIRIAVAGELLASGEYSPSEVATAVGFEDYPHFSKTFKRLMGKSPKEYRNSVLYSH